MRQLILFLAMFFLSAFASFAQMKKMENVSLFVKQMERSLAQVKSVESDFKQIKHIEDFNQDIASSGKFFYVPNDKICLKYAKPLPYLVVINGAKIKLLSGGKKNIMNLKDNKQMQEMQYLLTTCFTGNLLNISNSYHTEFYEDESFYLATIKPVNENVKKEIIQFDIYLNRKDMRVDKLRIYETAGDYTEYSFSNMKFNTLISNALFKI